MMNESLELEEPVRKKKRPGYLTALSAVLVLWGAGCSLAYAADTLRMITTFNHNSAIFALTRMLLLHAIWIAIGVGGVAVRLGKNWARGILFAAFINLIFFSATTSSIGSLVLKMVMYAVMTCLLFTPGSRAYFSTSP